jgi:hypothetical protein
VAINEDFHPYDTEGRLQPNLSVLGVLTEGVRYFTHYLPSPRSRLRAVYDAQDCVEAVIPSPRSRLRAVYDAQDCVEAVIG